MRIVIAGQTYHPAANGQAVFTVHLAEGLAQAGHDVVALVPSDQGRAYRRSLNGVTVCAVSSISFGSHYPEVYLSAFPSAEVSGLLTEFQPDLIHIQDHYPICRVSVRLGRKRHIPLIGTNHFLPENVIHYLPVPRGSWPFLTHLLWSMMLGVYNRLNMATTPTETAARVLREQRIRVPVYPVSCGVDLARFHPDPSVNRDELRRRYGLDPQRTIFLFVGRVDQEKRLDVLLRAMKQLDREDVQLAIAGKGRHFEAFQTQARQLGLAGKVIFTGYVPAEDLPALLNSVDIFAMPSEAELQSIATLEAMASSLPILAANARALPELVEDGVNGYLFRPGDSEDAARRMAQLMAERDRFPAMGQASAGRAGQHGLGTTVSRYEELYHVLMRTVQPVTRRQWFTAEG